MSVPYTPPSRVYLPVEELAQRAPNLGYQVYFANPKSSSEIIANVKSGTDARTIKTTELPLFQLKQFVRLLFRPPGSSSLNFTRLGLLEKYVQEPENHEAPSILNERVWLPNTVPLKLIKIFLGARVLP